VLVEIAAVRTLLRQLVAQYARSRSCNWRPDRIHQLNMPEQGITAVLLHYGSDTVMPADAGVVALIDIVREDDSRSLTNPFD